MISLKYFLAVIFFFILYPVKSFSQSNFSTGYIIDIQKDTIKGLIDYRNWDKTPEKIVFKNISDSKLTTYTPSDIKSFSVAGESYESGIVTIDESPFREDELTESDMPQNRTDTVFLQILINGPKSLYYLKDKNLKVHFFIRQTGGFETLLFIKYLQNVGGAMYVKEKELYKGQLVLYFQDFPSIQKKIYSVTYSKNNLIKLFNEYYKYTHNEVLYQQEPEKFKSEFGLLAGISKTKLKFTGDDFFLPLTSVDYPLSTNFTFGGFFNIIFPRKQGRLSIDNELTYVSYKTKGQYRDNPDINIYTMSYSSFGTSYIKLNDLVKIKFPVKEFFLFVDGGISNGISVSQTNYLRVETHVYSIHNISEREAIVTRRWERGILIGLGCSMKNYSCQLRIEKDDGISGNSNLASPSLMHSIIFGYKF